MVGALAHIAADILRSGILLLCQRRIFRQRQLSPETVGIHRHGTPGAKHHLHINLAARHIGLQLLLELDVVVAIDIVAGSNAGGILYRNDIALYHIGPHPGDAVLTHKHQPVTIA